MQNPLYKKQETPNYMNAGVQKAFVADVKTNKELLQKELDVNQQEQVLLQQKIKMMGDFLNNLPASDPQYNMLRTQMAMDQIEWDELKIRALFISQKIDDM